VFVIFHKYVIVLEERSKIFEDNRQT